MAIEEPRSELRWGRLPIWLPVMVGGGERPFLTRATPHRERIICRDELHVYLNLGDQEQEHKHGTQG